MNNMARLGLESEYVNQMSLMSDRSYHDLSNKPTEEGEEGGRVRWHEH